jgi:hypothetical protein
MRVKVEKDLDIKKKSLDPFLRDLGYRSDSSQKKRISTDTSVGMSKLYSHQFLVKVDLL